MKITTVPQRVYYEAKCQKKESKSKLQPRSLLPLMTAMHISNNSEISVLSSHYASLYNRTGLQEKSYSLSHQLMKFLKEG